MALASYAKLGGVPWLIQADRTIAHELVIGLGSCFLAADKPGKGQRLVGITTMFSGDGNYFLSNISKAAPIDGYKQAITEALRANLDRAKTQMGWQKGEHVRVIFHSFKPMKNIEADAVKEVAKEFSDFTVDLAFLHVIDSHPYLLFNKKQAGVMDYESRKTKGEYAPMRGSYLRLSMREALLIVTGPKEVKKPEDGMPSPLLLRLHPDSTFQDISYLTKQAFNFTAHSWRSFLPASMPVTIGYSEIMARMLGRLETIPRWNPDAMLGRLGRSRWFL